MWAACNAGRKYFSLEQLDSMWKEVISASHEWYRDDGTPNWARASGPIAATLLSLERIGWTCCSSPSAVRAATVQAKMLGGRYRLCWLHRHWTGESGACRLPGCNVIPGDIAHILSGECTALKPALNKTLDHVNEILTPFPLLLPPVLAALQGDREALTTFILDPSTDPEVISLAQLHGPGILFPLLRVSRAWVWAAHRTRMRLLGLERFLA